jgi:hypothetical protein
MAVRRKRGECRSRAVSFVTSSTMDAAAIEPPGIPACTPTSCIVVPARLARSVASNTVAMWSDLSRKCIDDAVKAAGEVLVSQRVGEPGAAGATKAGSRHERNLRGGEQRRAEIHVRP